MFPRLRFVSTLCFAALALGALAQTPNPAPGGELIIINPPPGAPPNCPLKHTAMEAHIVGQFCRTTVEQIYSNPLDQPIEVTYLFPLPEDGAIDKMEMRIGERVVISELKERQEARRVYEAAKAAGHITALLDQERPNLFTQSVANIPAGAEITVTIAFLSQPKLREGVYEYVFPTAVGPRFIPGGNAPATPADSSTAPTPRVPDAKIISPSTYLPPTRPGHDLSVLVTIEAPSKIATIESMLHEIDIDRLGDADAIVSLKNLIAIPNRDFILRYTLEGDEPQGTLFTHGDERGEFFTLVLQPPTRVVPKQLIPREITFVIDTSRSMNGFPLEKAREAMRACIETLNPSDTFNLIAFSSGIDKAFPQPVLGTPGNVALALKYLEELRANGGTNMLEAMNAALEGDPGAGRMKIIGFMTDGFIGNEVEIIDAVHHRSGQMRVFSFGVGNSANRYLLESLAREGCGEVEYVTRGSDTAQAAANFRRRIDAPVLTDIAIDWGGLDVAEFYPERFPDLFAEKPVVVHGRLNAPAGDAIVRLKGNTGAGAYDQPIHVKPEANGAVREALAELWARAKIKALMNLDPRAIQYGNPAENLKRQIIDLSIKYNVMTQFTSFIAVEYTQTVPGGPLVKIEIPQTLPEGMEKFVPTATNDPTLLTIGAALLALAILAGITRRRLVPA